MHVRCIQRYFAFFVTIGLLAGCQSAPLRAEDFLARGLANLRQGAYAQAVEDFSQALIAAPQAFKAYHYRATARVMLGQIDDALADYGRCIELKPDFAPAHINRGVALVGRGQCTEAIADFDRALAIDPRSAEALCHRAICRSRGEQYALAVADYRSALAIDPQIGDALNNLAWILATCPDPSLRQPTEAAELARRALQQQENAFYYDTLAAALAAGGDLTGAQLSQQKALALLPADRPADQRAAIERHLQEYREQLARQSTPAVSPPSVAPPPPSAILAGAEAGAPIAPKPAKLTPPAATPAPAASLPFSIQVSACQQSQTAREVAVGLRQRGVLAFWAPVELAGKGRWYRVYCQCLPSMAEAKSALEQMRRAGMRDALVVRTPFAILVPCGPEPQLAQRLEQELAQKGFGAYRLPGSENPGAAARLLVGAFESRDAAEILRRELIAAGYAAQVVSR